MLERALAAQDALVRVLSEAAQPVDGRYVANGAPRPVRHAAPAVTLAAQLTEEGPEIPRGITWRVFGPEPEAAPLADQGLGWQNRYGSGVGGDDGLAALSELLDDVERDDLPRRGAASDPQA